MKDRVLKLLKRILKGSHSEIVSFREPRSRVIDIMYDIRRHTEIILSLGEAYQLYALAKSTLKVPGDIAEVGAYKGGSARLMGYVQGDRTMHIFDTFEGLPAPSAEDGNHSIYKGQLTARFDEVKAYLADIKNLYLYKGLFPQTAGPINEKRFSLVHLDTDLYSSTKDSLEFFYPRMNSGGAIITHDYTFEGVKKAFDEFVADKPEYVIETATSQAIIIKR